MASSGIEIATGDSREGGFATPAAVIVSLALALIATAVTLNSVMELRLARADFERVTADYALAGAQQAVAMVMLRVKQNAPSRWDQATNAGQVAVLAEPEAPKLTPADAAAVGRILFAKFGATDATALADRLRRLPRFGSDFDVETADDAPLWRACARSMVSPYGTASSIDRLAPAAPSSGSASWKIGTTWRVRVTSANGWVDDRIVRFTGDAARPTSVVERRLLRTSQAGNACDKILSGGGLS